MRRRRSRSVDQSKSYKSRGRGLRNGRAEDSDDEERNGYSSRRARSVERPQQRHGALSYDDDDFDDRRPPSRYNSGYSADYISADDSSKGGKTSSFFWSTASSSKSKKERTSRKAERTKEANTMHQANEKAYSHTLAAVSDIEKLAQKKGANPLDERFKVLPDDSYPNTYFNRVELRQEMNRKSFYFHDTRLRSTRGQEVGQLRLEILQCFGIPTSSFVRETSAYCVAVCGPHAFKTDVMPPVANPMWLCKMRRACLFPVLNAHAKLYIGVFDNSSTEGTATDFIGRVVIDVARLRPMCTYDFTLPLRQSAHVFSRQQQGAIRVRVHLVWTSERSALLSYMPRGKIKFSPQENINISCLDDRSFRNIAHTVHGIHMPGKFSMTLLKATIREVNFTRIHVMRYLRKREVWNLVYWQYPFISGFVFFAWMHSVYTNTVRYVPGHIITFLLLHLYKNYAHYAMDSALQRGFMAPTIEEMLKALLFGSRKAKKKYIEPLNMEMDDSHAVNPMEHLDAADDYEEANPNSVPLSEVAESMRKSLRVQSHKYRLKTYKNCFLGNEAVDFLVQFGFAYSRPDAVVLGRRLARESRLFEHVARKHDFEDKDLFYHFLEYDTKKYVIKGHQPRGKGVLKLMGFLRQDNDTLLETRGHVEFPFATGVDHPRFTVKQALVIRSAEAKKILRDQENQQDIADCAEFGVVPPPPNDPARQLTNAAGEVVHVAGDVMKAGIGVVRAGVRRASLLGGLNTNSNAGKESGETVEEQETRPTRNSILSPSNAQDAGYADPDDIYAKLKNRNNPTLDELLEQQQNANAYDKFAYDSDEDVMDTIKKRNKGFIIEEKLLKKPPIQDLGVKGKGGDKSFAKTISEARHKAHALLFHLFNDRTYTIDQALFPPTLPEDPVDRESVRSTKSSKKKKKKLGGRLSIGGGKEKEEKEERKKRRMVTPFDSRIDEYDKLLQINKYSHSNPWINRVGVIVQPIVEIVQGWLCLFRALFNVFTWQDPILSFWVAIMGPVLVVVSHIMPYRILFFGLGIVIVGPQNYVLRLVRESRGDLPPDFDKILKRKRLKKEEKFEEVQYFSSEAPGNQNIKYVNVEPKQVKNIVVPYGPLKYNRFYDWPPEPEYARVYASPPPRSNLGAFNDMMISDDDFLTEDEGYLVDAKLTRAQMAKKKKKKKGIKKLASQVKKGTGTVVVVGGELASRTRTTTSLVAKGAVGLTKNTVMGTAQLTSNVAKGTVNATKGAVKGTSKAAGKAVKGTARGARGVLGGLRGKKKKSTYDDYDSDEEY